MKIIKKYWWLILIIIIVLIISYIVISNIINKNNDNKKEKEKLELERQRQADEDRRNEELLHPKLTKAELTKAYNSFENGIEIDDPKWDFVKMPGGLQGDGRPDNQNPERLAYTDLKKVYIGADTEYIFVKYEFYGNFPKEVYEFGDRDFLAGIGVNFVITSYYNHNLKKHDEAALLQLAITYVSRNKDQRLVDWDSVFLENPTTGTSTFGEANSKVKDENGEDTYGISTGNGKTYGGVGTNYLLAEFPLSNLGLKYGDQIIFEIGVESSSRVYHHQSSDALLDYGHEKSVKYITWTIGANFYVAKIPNY